MFLFKKKSKVDSIKDHEQDMEWVDAQLKSIESGRYTLKFDSKNENQGNFYCLVIALGIIPDLCYFKDHWSIALVVADEKHDYYLNLRCEDFKQAISYYTEIVEGLTDGKCFK